MLTEAESAPVVVGEKATSNVQLAPAASVAPQFWWFDGKKNDEAFVPVTVKAMPVSVVPPVLVRVTTL
jgi:hypothetical protein